MRRFIGGALLLLIGIAVPATFHGTAFLLTVWVLIALGGVALVVTSDPVKRPLLDALRTELQLPAPAHEGEKRELRRRLRDVRDELTSVDVTLKTGIKNGWPRYDFHLPSIQWEDAKQFLGERLENEQYDVFAAGYEAANQINRVTLDAITFERQLTANEKAQIDGWQLPVVAARDAANAELNRLDGGS